MDIYLICQKPGRYFKIHFLKQRNINWILPAVIASHLGCSLVVSEGVTQNNTRLSIYDLLNHKCLDGFDGKELCTELQLFSKAKRFFFYQIFAVQKQFTLTCLSFSCYNEPACCLEQLCFYSCSNINFSRSRRMSDEISTRLTFVKQNMI